MARTLAVRTAAASAMALLAPLTGCDDKVLLDIDLTAPEAQITAPAEGSAVSGVSFRVDVAATDDTGVDRVEFQAGDGSPIVDSQAPFSAVVITLAEDANSDLAIRVEAFDAAGNSAAAAATYTVRGRTVARLTDSPNDDVNPSWSPDGTRIAFQAKRNGDQFDLWAMDADGSNETWLTQDVNEDRNPAWSPDGNWIAFDSDRAGTYDVWLLPVATGEVDADAVTSANRDDVEPAWAAGGVDLYFASDRGTTTPFNIWRVPAVGNDDDAVQVTSFDDPDRAPAVSSGGQLAFASPLSLGSPHVYTVDTGSSDVTALTGDTGITESDPAWLPGTDVIVFSRDDGGGSNLWFQSVGGTTPVQATFGAGTFGDGGAAWSPSGDRLAFHSDRDGNLEIYVMQ